MSQTTLERLRAGELTGLKRLNLSCGLSELPREVFALADTLEILDLSGNRLSALPDDLPRLHKLRILFCSDNQFTVLPEVLGQCPQLTMVGFKANRIEEVAGAALPPALRWLILTDNRLARLPAAIGGCAQLQKLMLAGNCLQQLPDEMAACTRLELLRLAANQLPALPDWLLSLPRLAWLAYAGNPCAAGAPKAARVPGIDWHCLQLVDQLGTGASGVIHRASWRQGTHSREVAVKLFKGAVTSDGLPHDEMKACVEAGCHPQLIPVLGRIEGHPAALPGLVMPLIAPHFRTLAGPPSLESCTRDVYADNLRFSPAVVLRIASGIAGVARHLHGRGLLHGDLYAHNILHTDDGQVLLGDFGAATFVAPAQRRQAEALQRLEVRAFACLLAELLECCPQPLPALQALQLACDAAENGARPLFAEIADRLAALAGQA